MELLRQFFELNRTLVFFLYGLVFFVMGLAIALQSRRHSRLEMARGLGWLGAFGLAHGLHEWGVIFIPIQAAYLDTAVISFLLVLQVILLVLSFSFLFQFGAEMLRERWLRLVLAPWIVTVIWGLWFVMPGLTFQQSFDAWHHQSSTWARYLIGFPASLLAAYGLRYQAERHIKPLGLTHIYRTLQLAGASLLAYALLGGLIVIGGDFFPASWLNEANFVTWFGVPAPVFRSLTGLVLALAIIRALDVFDLEVDGLIEQMEMEQYLMAERQRIGRELHDGALQQVYSAGLLMEAARGKLKEDTPALSAVEVAVAGQRLDNAITALNEAIASLRAYMGELQPIPSPVTVIEGLRQQVTDPGLNALMKVVLKLDLPETTSFTPIQTSHVLAIVNEALSNAARHAQAHRVTLQAVQKDGQFQLTIEDNGRGLQNQSGGHGLRNMRDRARMLGGSLTVTSEPDKGTAVYLAIPLETK
ncbi:MAG: sensor histidine kinase [Anaerolinea sp.]|nr:sensor histidine kinase [Anaerolinea sp.]